MLSCVQHFIPQYPSLCSKINGEESAEFTNSLGESITVRVCASECDTVALLGRVMDSNKAAASMLASAVHKDLPLPHIPQEQLKAVQSVSLCPSQLGIWIDPIGKVPVCSVIHRHLTVCCCLVQKSCPKVFPCFCIFLLCAYYFHKVKVWETYRISGSLTAVM